MIRFCIYNLVTLASFFLLTACIKEADEVKVPTSKDMKIVVRGMVGENEGRIYITQTLPFFNKDGYAFNEQYVKDAIVTISDGKDTVRLRFIDNIYEELGSYGYSNRLPLDFKPGLKLYLQVNLPDGRHVDAVSTVPDAVDVTVSKLDSMYTGYRWIYGYKCINNSRNPAYALGHYEYYTYYDGFVDVSKDTLWNVSNSKSHRLNFNSPDQPYTQSYFYTIHEYEKGSIGVTYRKYDLLRFLSFSKYLKDYNLGKSIADHPLSGEPIYTKDSTDFTQEPRFSEPIYYDYYSNVNGGLGYFEVYQENIVELK